MIMCTMFLLTDVTFKHILSKPQQLRQLLVVNYSIPAPDVDTMFNSSVNFTEVGHILVAGKRGKENKK